MQLITLLLCPFYIHAQATYSSSVCTFKLYVDVHIGIYTHWYLLHNHHDFYTITVYCLQTFLKLVWGKTFYELVRLVFMYSLM